MRGTEERNKAIPFVQKTVEFSQQIQNTFEAIPQYFEAQDWNSVYEPLRQSRDYLASISVMTPTLHAAVSGAAMCNSAGSAVMTVLLNTVPDPDANAKAWVTDCWSSAAGLQSDELIRVMGRERAPDFAESGPAEMPDCPSPRK